MKFGDKIVCDNGKTYKIEKSNSTIYEFDIVDKENVVVNKYTYFGLKDCMPYYEEDQHTLNVDGEYVRILELIES